MEIYGIDASPGMIGISAMPGLVGGLEVDAAAIANWGAELVLTMTGEGEMERMGFTGFGQLLTTHGIAWHHIPVSDFGATPLMQAAGLRS